MRENVAILAKDALKLVDLQMQLLSLDIWEFWRRARIGIVVCVLGIATMLAALPVLLLGLSEFVSVHAGLSTEASMFIVAILAIIAGGIALWVSIRQLTKAGSSLKRSQNELRSNLEWLRSVIGHDDE